VKLNTPKRTLAVILALGGCAVAVDKFVIGYSAPATAAAATTPDAIAGDLPASSPSNTALKPEPSTTPAASAPSLTTRLAKLGNTSAAESSAPDPFQRPAAWTPRSQPAPETTPAVTAPAVEADLSPAPALRLSMIMFPKGGQSESPVAIINGQPYKQGEQVEGFTIEAVTPESISLRKGARTLDLALPRPASERKRP
jgi:hypothetical protein